MTRVKVFESTGVAPNGRLYAGDLNAIQDHYADQVNFSQEVDAAAFGIGESALKLLRYGPSEARLTGSMRTDGIVRALGGLFAGAFTTAQRDAIAVGSRPYGLIILNTTTNQYEWNRGTDPAPSWAAMSPPVSEVQIGSIQTWPWGANTVPVGYVLPFGQTLLRSTYSTLHGIAQNSGYPYGNGDGSTTFGILDMRGRIAAGKDDMGGAAAGRLTVGISGISGASLGAVGGAEGVTLTTGQIPAHNHAVTGSPALTGAPAMSGSPSLSGSPSMVGSVGFNDGGHNHSVNDPQHRHGGGDLVALPVGNGLQGGPHLEIVAGTTDYASTGIYLSGSAANITVNNGSLGVNSGSLGVNAGSLGVNAGSLAANAGSLGTANTGGGAVHANVQPTVIVNMILKAV